MKTKYDECVIVAEYKLYHSCQIVAEKIGCSDEHVRRILIRNNVERVTRKTRPRAKKTSATEQELRAIVADYYESSGNINDLAKKWHRSQTTISRAIKKYGHGFKYCEKNAVKITDEQLIEESKKLTRKEIAEKYHVNVVSIDKRMSRLGIHAQYKGSREKSCDRYGRIDERYIADEIDAKSDGKLQLIEYITEKNSRHYKVFCSVCGEYSTIGVARFKNTCTCPVCEEREKERQLEKKEQEKARTQFVRVLRALSNSKTPRVCERCGETFYSEYATKKYCSKKCATNKIHRDKRIPKTRWIDSDITVKKLYKRDDGKCYLCGGQCDFSDWRVAESGHKYPGDLYPTKDHVIPVSLGGCESWDNVRLAHWKCNLEKSNDVVTVSPMPKKIAYSKKWRPNTKRTAQYSLDGELIRVWESTAQIHRELGLNDKHIQNVCRRCESNTGNAYGYHWEYINDAAEVS